MSSITIHAIDTALDTRLSEEARQRGSSKNQLVKDLLAQALGLPVQGQYADDYREFAGAWTVAETADFNARLQADSQIDQDDWQ